MIGEIIHLTGGAFKITGMKKVGDKIAVELKPVPDWKLTIKLKNAILAKEAELLSNDRI